MARDESQVHELTGLPNVGMVLAERLEAVGIETPAQLRALGSVEALVRIQAKAGADAPCRSKLSALEGAIRGIRWHGIPKAERDELWRQYQSRLHEHGFHADESKR
jgi:DNA transformation protein